MNSFIFELLLAIAIIYASKKNLEINIHKYSMNNLLLYSIK